MPAVLADATHLQQALINLVTNVMQAMPGPGRIVIRLDSVNLDAALLETHPALRALHSERSVRLARVAVSDTGPGMDAATRERIFEPFFTTKLVGEGTGLGLSVVHGIVEGHDGVVAVAIRPELPVAVTSGFIDETLQAQAAVAGVRELIFKADSVKAFCDAVQRLALAVATNPKIS